MVSARLTSALIQAGINASMLVTERTSDNEAVHPMGTALGNQMNFLLERAEIFARNGFSKQNLFAIDTGRRGTDVTTLPQVRQADVVVLNWINQGTMSLHGVERLAQMGKPVVWIMHDMWNCTGICHHAHECNRYTDICRHCPLLKRPSDHDISTTVWQRKKALYSAAGIHFVAVSNWLAECCRKSALMKDARISVIHNAFPVEQFSCQPDDSMGLNLHGDKRVIVMGARRLDEPVKGFDHMIRALRFLADNNPQLASRLHLVLYGDIRDRNLLQRIPTEHTWLGHVASTQELNRIYRNAHIVLSTSLYENLPGTLIEGAASGCVPVSYLRGGQADIISHMHNGFLAEWNCEESLAKGIEWAAQLPISRQALHDDMDRRFNSRLIAEQFINLFNELTTKHQ